jgi:tetratricopeptide (TPR) repeat protein
VRRLAAHERALVTVLAACTAASAVAAASPQAPAPVAATDPLAAANAAQEAYERGIELSRADPAASQRAFAESAAGWERLRAEGFGGGALEFNLGNAYMQSGDLGRAIARYLAAERDLPGDADLAGNLAQARARVASSFERSGGTVLVEGVARAWHVVPAGARHAIFWSGWVAFWILLAVRVAVGPGATAAARGALAASLWTSGLAGALFGGSLLADAALRRTNPKAVLVDRDVVLRKGNGDGFEQAFAETLGPGVECAVLEERPGWLRVGLPDGRTGWIRQAQAERP